MESKINDIVMLDNGYKFMILDHGVYNMKNYFLSTKVDENDNLTNELSILEETSENGKITISTVKDERLAKALAEYFSIRNAKD